MWTGARLRLFKFSCNTSMSNSISRAPSLLCLYGIFRLSLWSAIGLSTDNPEMYNCIRRKLCGFFVFWGKDFESTTFLTT